MKNGTQRIAVSSLDHQGLDAAVSPHFGRCPAFTMVQVEDGRIQSHEIVSNPLGRQHQPGQIPAFLAGLQATAVLAGGMGRRAMVLFEQCGIQTSVGHQGTVRGAVEAFLEDGPLASEGCAGGHPDGCAGHGGS